MPIFRWLIIGLAVWLAFVIVRRLIHSHKHQSTPKNSASPYSVVVACHYCNLHIPKTEALQTNDRYYCSRQHQDAEHSSD